MRRVTASGFALAVYGFATMAGQILILRQLIAVLYGNELSIGLFLSAWLVLTALGSALLGPLLARLPWPEAVFGALQVLFGLCLVGELVVVRLARQIFYPEVLLGELVGVREILLVPPLILAPICVLSGAQFTVGSKMHRDPGLTYAAVAAGDLLGGLLVSSVLVLWLGPFALAGAVLVLSFVAAAVLARGRWRLALGVCTAAVAVALCLGRLPALLDVATLAREWAPLRVDSKVNSVHGEIVVTGTKELFTFYQGGEIVFQIPDEHTVEDLIHFPLLAHPRPRSVLLVGLGVAGGVAEALKHGVQRVDYAELDPRLYRVGLRYARLLGKRDIVQSLRDRRVRVFLEDGRLYIRRTHERYDAVLVNVPDPGTIQLNRFYTLEFFREVRRILNPGGIVSVTISSNPVFLGDNQARLNACVVRTMAAVFEHVALLPGDEMIVVGTTSEKPLATDAETLARRLRERKINNLYVTESYITVGCDRTQPFTREQVLAALARVPPLALNRDFFPVCNFYQTSFWSALIAERGEKSWAERVLGAAARTKLEHILAALVIIALLLSAAGRAAPRLGPLVLLGNVGAMAFVGLTLEVAILFAFQAIYGYVYYKIGMLDAAFMVGSVVGSRWGSALLRDREGWRSKRALSWMCVGISELGAAYTIAVPALIFALAQFRHAAATFVAMQVLFPVLAAVAGFLVGLIFPLACRLLVRGDEEEAQHRPAGLVYGADLAGAALGSFAAGAVVILAFGLWGTCAVAAAALALAGLAWAFVAPRALG